MIENTQALNKKNIFLWALYDFANSIVIVAFFLYFSQWLVADAGVSDFWYNMIFVGSTVLLVITAPVYGAIADRRQVYMKYLRIATILQFLFCLLSGLVALFGNKILHAGLIAGLCYMLAIYFYQFSFCFYNPLLVYLAPAEKQGRISGYGQAANWLGQIAGIFISLPLLKHVSFFGASGRVVPLVPSAIIFFLLALPMLIFFHGPRKTLHTDEITTSYRLEISRYFKNLKSLWLVPGVGAFLLGFFFFNDAVLTSTNNFPIYLEKVFHLGDTKKSILLLAILVTSVIGALIGGYLNDKLGGKKALMGILIGWMILFPSIGLQSAFNIFAGLTIVMGLLYGATWSVTRAVMARLVPKDNLNHSFSYYTLAERFANVTGPLTWGLVSTLLASQGALAYRVAISSMAVFILVGIFFARKIPSDNNLQIAG
jgi:UMF1 family MFS transporter